jgi:hypothetical protein
MNYMPTVLLILVMPTILVVQIYFRVRKMSEPEKMMKPITGGLNPEQLNQLLPYKDWLISTGLEYRTGFQFGSITAGVFQQGNQPRFLMFRFHPKLTFSAESYGTNHTDLDTSTHNSIGVMPRPGAYGQSFPDISSPQEMWQLHLEGEAHLTKKFGVAWLPLNQPYDQVAMESLRIRITHTRSQLFWPFRVLYRVLVTRHRVANRTIALQFP